MADPLQLDGYQVGDIFARVVLDVRRSVPPGMTSAIDVQLEFSSLKISEKGFFVLFTNKATNESSMSIKIATRVHVDAGVVSNETLVRHMQTSLLAEGVYTGPVDGLMSPAVDAAIVRAINLPANSDLRPTGRKFETPAARRTAYLQHTLNKQLVVKIDVDGEDGPETSRALFLLFGDYSVTRQ